MQINVYHVPFFIAIHDLLLTPFFVFCWYLKNKCINDDNWKKSLMISIGWDLLERTAKYTVLTDPNWQCLSVDGKAH